MSERLERREEEERTQARFRRHRRMKKKCDYLRRTTNTCPSLFIPLPPRHSFPGPFLLGYGSSSLHVAGGRCMVDGVSSLFFVLLVMFWSKDSESLKRILKYNGTRTARQVNKTARQVNKTARQVNKTARQVNKTARRVNKTARQVNKTAVRLLHYR
jgi:hypothetical protein